MLEEYNCYMCLKILGMWIMFVGTRKILLIFFGFSEVDMLTEVSACNRTYVVDLILSTTVKILGKYMALSFYVVCQRQLPLVRLHN